ncbi:MAG: ubiquitin-like small modifier protein 1 [Candidatus Bipolaricaulia bacterium]
MGVTVKFFSSVRDRAGSASTELEVDNARELLEELEKRHEELKDFLLTETDSGPKVKDGVTVMVNGRNIRFLDGLRTELTEGDKVAIFPPVGGG